jgi:hypothetical protein
MMQAITVEPCQDPQQLMLLFRHKLLQELLRKGQQLVRYFGWYSNKNRGLRNPALMVAAGPAAQNISLAVDNSLHGSAHDSLDTPWGKACRRTWAQFIEKVYLVSPLVRPKCRSKMNIISFIEDPAVVRKILKHSHPPFSPHRPAFPEFLLISS